MEIGPDMVTDLEIDPGPSRRTRSLRRKLSAVESVWSWATGSRRQTHRKLQKDEEPPAAPGDTTEVDLGKDSIEISYTIDSHVGTDTVADLKEALVDAVDDGTLDALAQSRAGSNTSALENVEFGMPRFSNEYFAPPTSPSKPGFPAYGIALIVVSLFLVLCGAAYGYYYFVYEKHRKEHEKEQLMTGHQSSSYVPEPSEFEMGNAMQPKPQGEEQVDSYGSNPYAGQIPRAPRRISQKGPLEEL